MLTRDVDGMAADQAWPGAVEVASRPALAPYRRLGFAKADTSHYRER